MKNALAALRHYLADYAEVNVLCDGRVYTGDSIPLDDTEKRPKPCVLLRGSSGQPSRRLDTIIEQSFDVICLEETAEKASRLDLAVFQAIKTLDRKIVDGVLLHNVLASPSASQEREQETLWPATRRPAVLRADEREVE